VTSELDFRHASATATVRPFALQPDARGLHESEGYVPIGNFNGNPVATFFGEKRLYG
jgi:hypothetical protein